MKGRLTQERCEFAPLVEPMLASRSAGADLETDGRAANSFDVVLICASLAAGGTERVVATLANEWSRCGRKVCVITRQHQTFYALYPAVRRVIVHGPLLPAFARSFRRLVPPTPSPAHDAARPLRPVRDVLDRVYSTAAPKYDAWALRRVLLRIASPVIVSMGWQMNLITVEAAKGLGRRVILSERCDPRGQLQSRLPYRGADLVTTATHDALRSLSEIVEPEKLAYVPNPLALPPDRGARQARSESPVVLTVGRLVLDKAPDVLVEAFALAVASHELSGWRLSIAGRGPLERGLQTRTQELGISGLVAWHGTVEDVWRLYAEASIFVLASRSEGMPNALIEAMSSGLAVVVTDCAPGPLQLVEDGVTGLVVPVDNPVALAAAIRRLAGDKHLRQRLGRAAQARVSEHVLSGAVPVWDSVLGLRPAVPPVLAPVG